jgi:hypothetical protein
LLEDFFEFEIVIKIIIEMMIIEMFVILNLKKIELDNEIILSDSILISLKFSRLLELGGVLFLKIWFLIIV